MTIEELKEQAGELGFPCVIPLVKVIRNNGKISPTDVYSVLQEGKGPSFLLESAELGEKVARYSFLGRDPERMIILKDGILDVNGTKTKTSDPLKDIKDLVLRYNVSAGSLPKFFGGMLGFFGYDMVRYFEGITDKTRDDLGHPDAQFMFVKDLVAFDHWREEILLISNLTLEKEADLKVEYERALMALESLEKIINKTTGSVHPSPSKAGTIEVKSSFSKRGFESAVKSALEHIYAGDIFQVVLSQRLEVEGEFDPFMVYGALKDINPSPYMYLLDLGSVRIIGSSPEILVKVDGRRITLRPIAGTRPRGKDIVEDEVLAREMVNDEKERAEHVMLVDLGRNDVGRVSRFGTVDVTEFFGVEKYSHVQHIISNVQGKLREGLSSFDALEASFPAGTVTGAPKVRAMEIIEDLEPTRRGVYAGSLGYFSFNGDMDFAITIRTIVLQDCKAYVQAGAGIVADSIPEKEFEETMNKGRGMLRALESAGERRD